MTSACKLCQAFAATGFDPVEESDPTGTDNFTRDPDICDACLNHDFAPRRSFGVFERFSMLIGFLIAFPSAIVLVANKTVLFDSFPALTLFALTAAGTVIFGVIIWLVLRLILHVRTSAASADPTEAAAEAERFYYLALWGALTGRYRFERQMLKQARSLGFRDHHRLNDPRLGAR